ncbi:MAG: alpha/beta fold hydrolase [Candidatus Dormibacteraeota bacterium]|nr:alpha/beta fold hydrolase [Candidatus Dormibacteraeota bacterium]
MVTQTSARQSLLLWLRVNIEHGTLRAGGLEFDYLESGPRRGRLVLLLHGFPQSSSCWLDALQALGDAGFHAVAPDQRGYCEGARPDDVAAYRVDVLAGDVIAIADALGAKRFHLIGHDWGGTVAWTVAAEHATRIRSLVALSTPHTAALARALRGMEQRARLSYFAVLQLPYVPEALFETAGGIAAEQALTASGLPRQLAHRDVDHIRSVGAGGPLNWYRALRLQRRPSTRPVEVPVLYVWGTRDVAFGREAAENTEQYVNAAYHFVELEDANHWIPDLYWDDIADLVLAHLRSA